ncbi:hypothetical protein [Smaragdicoccus niigatensis]|uniref:hypothetical protein n=1 Tax=Smaragdicoccus niigatensis TaxID=359359 RepID=UPI0009DB7915|nr:hypothetical protein [Smaragdicoccus niigatensis]
MTITSERPRARRRQRPAGLHLSPAGLRAFLAVVVAVQILKGVTAPLSIYTKSAWFVDYRYGFVRRGLGGQITGQSELAVNAAIAMCWVLPIIAIVVVLELLVRRWTAASTSLAILLACSPLVVGELAYFRRTDQLGLVVLVLVGVACLQLRRSLLPTLAGLGVVLAVLVFVHEATLLIWGLAAVPMVFVTGNRSRLRNIRLSAAAVGPGLLALVGIVIAGRVTPAVATQLREDAALGGPTVFRFLSQGIADSFGEVSYVGLSKHLAQLTLGALLILVHVVWIRRSVGLQWVSMFTRLDRRTLLAVSALTGGTVFAVFATGIDWMRWFSSFGATALVVVAFAVLAVDERPMSSRTVHVSWTQVAVVAYLTILSPTPEFEPSLPIPDVGAAHRLLGL